MFVCLNISQAALTAFVCWYIIFWQGRKILAITDTRSTPTAIKRFAWFRANVIPSSMPSISFFIAVCGWEFLQTRVAYLLPLLYHPAVLFSAWGLLFYSTQTAVVLKVSDRLAL